MKRSPFEKITRKGYLLLGIERKKKGIEHRVIFYQRGCSSYSLSEWFSRLFSYFHLMLLKSFILNLLKRAKKILKAFKRLTQEEKSLLRLLKAFKIGDLYREEGSKGSTSLKAHRIRVVFYAMPKGAKGSTLLPF